MGRLESKRTIKLLLSFLDIKAAKINSDQVNQVVVSYRPDLSLQRYIQTWESCIVCNSIRVPEMTSKGIIRLVCNHCNNNGVINRRILQRYIDYIQMKCRNCNKTLEVIGSQSNTAVVCEKYNELVDVKLLW